MVFRFKLLNGCPLKRAGGIAMNLLQECKDGKKIGIGGHIRPDGDCVGSCLALYQYLSKCMKDTYIKVFLEKPSDIFKEIKGFDEIDSSFKEDTVFDVFFVLDSTDDRMGRAKKYFDSAHKTINIDHHVSNCGCGMVNYIWPDTGSTSELIYDLMDSDFLDHDMAKAIYIGMIHDMGIFQYSSTTPESLEKAAHLMRFGIDFSRLIEETFYQKTYVQTQVLGRALMESVLLMDGKCVASCLDRRTMEFYGVQPTDLEGIVNHLRYIKGVDCAIFLYQTKTGEYKISMRSSNRIDVSRVAAYFGGGGHARAAGCAISGNLRECIDKLSVQIGEQYESGE
jgi:phosphoesterase RecJ-like protein